jgi:hypothetical protein
MPDTDEQPAEELEDLETTEKVNFRDYPSSGLVVIAALSSGLGWMLYKWLGRKRRERNGDLVDPKAMPETPAPGRKKS